MRKFTAFLFISLDGVVEAPNLFVRPNLYEDFDPLIAASIAGQDAVLLGRTMYEEWSAFWPGSDIQPFADFINAVPKFVVSRTLTHAGWPGTTILPGPFDGEMARLKTSDGGTVGVSGIRLIQSLLVAGLLDELQFCLVPVVAGSGRRLLEGHDTPVQLDLVSAQTTRAGLQYLIYRPRA
ncbi:dihydrofolate reductase family protein [Glacieibacterium frigidum]|uniref:Bacterial bifunctional deaminase-reductase C-terminal domain-containing protein n=1 Tax=Glacieibacterium frigidum TaxID=2593303 RepID=A0A552U9L5_9SPHN|nr:dihydrofolate reductase family protein [Glacieibacterium frigidum]TRW14908.1 hypothetical protein FMM06_14680 [Glacieibacterium frigidum]